MVDTVSDAASSICPFCERDALTLIADDGLVFVALDRHPINRGHLLVAPRRHARELSELTEAEAATMGRLARAADLALRNTFGGEVTGTTLWMSNGIDQDVFHAHLHVIPRTADDGLEIVEDVSRYPLSPLTPPQEDALRSALHVA